MGLDIRLPIGAMFTALGLLIGGYGVVTSGDGTTYSRSLGINVNLWWGLVMLVFGVTMLIAGRRGKNSQANTGK